MAEEQTGRSPNWWDQKRSRLRDISRRIFDSLDECSYVDVGYLPRAFLDDYVSGGFFLIDKLAIVPAELYQPILHENIISENEELAALKPTARKFCLLSRDVLYSMDEDRIPGTLRAAIEELFSLSACLIPDSDDAELREYRQHIEGRAFSGSDRSGSQQTDGVADAPTV